MRIGHANMMSIILVIGGLVPPNAADKPHAISAKNNPMAR